MRRAEWRWSVDDPTTALDFLRRWPGELYEAQARYEAIGMAIFTPFWLAWLFMIPALPMLGGSAIALIYGWGYGLLAFFGIVALEVSVAIFSSTPPTGPIVPLPERSLSTLDRLATLPPTLATYPVRASMRFRGALTGTDEAIVSFTDGWLAVEGNRMSCSLLAKDGRGAWSEGIFWIHLPGDESLALRRIVTPNFPDRSLRGRHGRFGQDFKEDAEDWLQEESSATGVSVFPPLLTHPMMRRGWTALLVASLILVVTAVFLILFAKGLVMIAPLPFIFLGGGGFVRSLAVRQRQTAADRRALEAV